MENIYKSISERLNKSASVSKVYGDPIVTKDKTIIPVARIGYGFGGGNAKKGKQAGGGGVGAHPIGVLEVTDKSTRFIPFHNRKKLLAVLAAGILIGMWLKRR